MPESVWEYPRPPKLERTSKVLRVEFSGVVIAETRNALRLLETSHPPTYYIPKYDVRTEYLLLTTHTSFCEFKGRANYWTIKVGERKSENAAWSYPNPAQPYQVIKDYFAFYPSRVDACFVDGERVKAQMGDFYGGWITADLIGPFKGERGTEGW
jgi:uncharacterized protein (DUF427 family)